MACIQDPTSGQYLLNSNNETVVCFQGQHIAVYLIAIICFILFLPTATYLSLFFLEVSAGTIGFISQFLLYERAAQLILITIGVFIADLTNQTAVSYGLIITTLIINTLLALLYSYLCPCQHQVKYFFYF